MARAPLKPKPKASRGPARVLEDADSLRRRLDAAEAKIERLEKARLEALKRLEEAMALVHKLLEP